MATITNWSDLPGNATSEVAFESALAGPTDTVEMADLPQGLGHVSIGVQMFSDAVGTTQVVSGAGSFTLTVKTRATNWWETFQQGATINATAPLTASVGGPITAAKAVPSGLSGVTTWKLVVVKNRS